MVERHHGPEISWNLVAVNVLINRVMTNGSKSKIDTCLLLSIIYICKIIINDFVGEGMIPSGSTESSVTLYICPPYLCAQYHSSEECSA